MYLPHRYHYERVFSAVVIIISSHRLSISTLPHLSSSQVAPMAIYGEKINWEHLNQSGVELLNHLKTSYLIRIIVFHPTAWNGLVIFLPTPAYSRKTWGNVFTFRQRPLCYTWDFLKETVMLEEIYRRKHLFKKPTIFDNKIESQHTEILPTSILITFW